MFKTITKSAHIDAPVEKVWEVLFTKKFYEEWGTFFIEGATFETDWQVGSKVIFKDPANSGLVGKILENVPNEFLAIEYYAELIDGKEDETSKGAIAMKGAQETYSVHGHGNHTHLDIEAQMEEEYVDMMSEAWDKAIEKIVELSESN